MNPTSKEASLALAEAERVLFRTRRAIIAAHATNHLIIWGAIWMLGFGAMHFTAWNPGWIWAPLAAGGAVLSAWAGWRVRHVYDSTEAGRIFWFFGALAAFAVVWAVLLYPFNPARFGAYIATVFMFSYVAGGIWFGRFFVILGSFVTAIALLTSLLAPALLNLALALAGGGSLLAAGMHLRRNWR